MTSAATMASFDEILHRRTVKALFHEAITDGFKNAQLPLIGCGRKAESRRLQHDRGLLPMVLPQWRLA
jgi:hypothetical protein